MSDSKHEPTAVAERYARRRMTDRYSLLKPDVWQAVQERQREMLKLFVRLGWNDVASMRLLEVGCGSGGNLQELLRLGFAPQHLTGVDLLADRIEAARVGLPSAVTLHQGDASRLAVQVESLDIVFVSTVFSSLLADAFQQRLAHAMWRWVKPGGGVLWYDFTYNNPRNPDVRGVPRRRIQALFPEGRMTVRRVTLAPPISRRVCRISSAAYGLFNALPFLRTHLLCWIAKPSV